MTDQKKRRPERHRLGQLLTADDDRPSTVLRPTEWATAETAQAETRYVFLDAIARLARKVLDDLRSDVLPYYHRLVDVFSPSDRWTDPDLKTRLNAWSKQHHLDAEWVRQAARDTCMMIEFDPEWPGWAFEIPIPSSDESAIVVELPARTVTWHRSRQEDWPTFRRRALAERKARDLDAFAAAAAAYRQDDPGKVMTATSKPEYMSQLEQHAEWAVLAQVCGYEYPRIGDEKKVRKAVLKFLERIELKPRERSRGRRRGSRNRSPQSRRRTR